MHVYVFAHVAMCLHGYMCACVCVYVAISQARVYECHLILGIASNMLKNNGLIICDQAYKNQPSEHKKLLILFVFAIS